MELITIIGSILIFLIVFGFLGVLIARLLVMSTRIPDIPLVVGTIVTVIILVTICTTILVNQYKGVEEHLQNGCECGGRYGLYDTEYSENRGDIYYYKCDKCGDIFETTFRIKLNEENIK